jgi:membrane-associated phospholipid phosphatase
VYLGEHYVTDLLAGWLLVEALWRAEPYALPLVRFANAALRTAEARVRRSAGPSRRLR